MQLAEYYRSYELPWEINPEEQRRLRRLLSGGLLLLLLLGVILPFIHLPKPTEAPEAVPERLARLMVEEKPKPPPVVEPPKPKPETKPVPVPKPVDKTAEARKKAQNSGLLKFQDELADLRSARTVTPNAR
jgi:protein TonB